MCAQVQVRTRAGAHIYRCTRRTGTYTSRCTHVLVRTRASAHTYRCVHEQVHTCTGAQQLCTLAHWPEHDSRPNYSKVSKVDGGEHRPIHHRHCFPLVAWTQRLGRHQFEEATLFICHFRN